ncbi:MAG TPA: HesA/MoeB/ThiF family protein [Syntrophorhabdales bacterium]|nr:HesA/MoeB/ThiF family protein [Syntrophorhabdales bacterium]
MEVDEKKTELRDHLLGRSKEGLLSWADQRTAAELYGMSLSQVEEVALEAGLLPTRYQRNRKTLSIEDQLKLLRGTVAIIGCGGLGGYIVEELARIGVGQLRAIDPDVFEEHNLNRQLMSSIAALGQPKVEAASARVAQINPAVEVLAVRDRFSRENGRPFLGGVSVAVDALDNIITRLELAEVCSDLGVPLVHGSIAGWYGQIVTQLPGESTLQAIYGRCAEGVGVEKHLGNPSFTPAVVASLQVAEVCKILLGRGTSVTGAMLTINLLDMQFSKFKIKC